MAMTRKLISSYQRSISSCPGDCDAPIAVDLCFADNESVFFFVISFFGRRDESEWLNVWDESVDAVRQTKVVCAVETLQPAAPLPRTGACVADITISRT